MTPVHIPGQKCANWIAAPKQESTACPLNTVAAAPNLSSKPQPTAYILRDISLSLSEDSIQTFHPFPWSISCQTLLKMADVFLSTTMYSMDGDILGNTDDNPMRYIHGITPFEPIGLAEFLEGKTNGFFGEVVLPPEKAYGQALLQKKIPSLCSH